MSAAVKPEPMGEDEEAATEPLTTPAPTVSHSKAPAVRVDLSLAVLAQLHERVKQQHTECSRAFASLQLQIVETVRAQQQALSSGPRAGCPAPTYYSAASGAVRAASVLFRYLFEGLFVHQLVACQDLANGLERAALQHKVRAEKNARGEVEGEGTDEEQTRRETAAAIAELQEAVHLLRQMPVRVQLTQRGVLPEMPLMMGPVASNSAAAARGTAGRDTASSSHTPEALSSHTGEPAAGQAKVPAGAKPHLPALPPRTGSRPSQHPGRARRLFAVSAAYSVAEQHEITLMVKAKCHCEVLLLPPQSAVTEEEAAANAGCCCLVTEQPLPHLRPQHASATIARTSKEHLQSFTAARGSLSAGLGGARSKLRSAVKPEPDDLSDVTANVVSTAATTTNAETSSSNLKASTSPSRASEPTAQQQQMNEDEMPCDSNPAPLSADDDDDEDDTELMELLELLDEAAGSTNLMTAGSNSLAPLSPSSQHLSSERFSFSTSHYPGSGLDTTALSGPDTPCSSDNPLTAQLVAQAALLTQPRGCSDILGADGRGVLGGFKRPRPYIVERASAGYSKSAHGDAEPPPRMPRRGLQGVLSAAANDNSSSTSADVDGAEEEAEVIPTQELPLAALESQTVQYLHVGSVGAGRHWLATAVAETDPCDALERALVERRPPPQRWLFQVSNSCRERRREIVEAIRQLGSEVDTGNVFNVEATHLVVAEGITERTEKYLSACAAGTFIVPPRYVFESAQRGHWLLGRMAEFNASPLRRYFTRAGPERSALLALPRLFSNWHVLLLVSHPSVASGISTVLRAGGCTDLQVCIFTERPSSAAAAEATGAAPHVQLNTHTAAVSDNDVDSTQTRATQIVHRSPDGYTDGLSSDVVFADELLGACTHILVECLAMSCRPDNVGNFELPPWMPVSLMQPALYPRVFTLELLYYCLCTSPGQVFSEEGTLLDEDRLIPACRVEPFEEDLAPQSPEREGGLVATGDTRDSISEATSLFS